MINELTRIQVGKRIVSELLSTEYFRARVVASVCLLVGVALLSSCGSSSQSKGPLSGNWQFSTIPLQAGFLLQSKGSVTGQVTYSVSDANGVCNSGAASVTGTATGQNVTLQAVAGAQTFALTGTLSADGSTITGTYNSTDGQSCGAAQSGAAWQAIRVPSLSGNVQGNLHSTGQGQVASLMNGDFLVTGFLVQGPNIGASSANVTGSLNFQGYPCLATASVNGQISGSFVILQIIGANGLNVGQIGAPSGLSNPGPVTFQSSAGGYVLQGSGGYGLSTKSCKGGNSPGDLGNICLAIGGSTACTQPVTLSPASLTFPPQFLGSSTTAQSITLTNTDPSGTTLNGLQLSFKVPPGSGDFPVSDFNGLPNLTEQDNCATSLGSTFSLASQQSCTITVSFSPQQSCPWLPVAAAPSQCPPFLPASVSSPPALGATLTVTSPTSADADKSFAVPISGVGLSAIQPSTPELDFGAEIVGEQSPSQSVSFTNQGTSAVQILPAMSAPPCNSSGQSLSRPLIPSAAPGVQVVTGTVSANGSTITYFCDIDTISGKPNFQIDTASDTCSGTLLAPQQACSVTVIFAPQPGTSLTGSGSGLDYFLELNTLECTSSTTTNCEIDAGRFPVELKANYPSPLRISPAAGLNFGVESRSQTGAPLTITLFNDPNDPNSQTIHFTGNVVKGDYAETDNCGNSLAPGSSCTMSIRFTPSVIGFDQGSITITYNAGQTQIVYLRGTGQ